MPNIVNEVLYAELERDFKEAGSCLVLEFDKLTVEQDEDIRTRLREAGVGYRVVKNRLATRAVKEVLELDMAETFKGKCGVVFAPEEKAISAAKMIREVMKSLKKHVPMRVIGGIIEGEAITGDNAEMIADMPDRNTVNAQMATAIIGPARALATVLQGLHSGMARCVQAKIDKGEG